MLRTRVGYCGGDKESPSYYSMGDHTEAISIDYDPSVISYSDLLVYFWKGHRCDASNTRTQYMNAVFYRNEEQKKLAEESMVKWAANLGVSTALIATKILPVKEFTYAEKYHQKYQIRGSIRRALDDLYPNSKALADSTVATRLNAYLGYGIQRDKEKFLAELGEYGLPEKLESKVRKSLDF